jgi:hypothetical protein
MEHGERVPRRSQSTTKQDNQKAQEIALMLTEKQIAYAQRTGQESSMNIIEYLEKHASTLGALGEACVSQASRQQILSEIEMDIREGIAQELEELVANHKPVKNWGVPNSAAVFAQTTAITPTNPAIQQEYFRAAANCVRGRHMATEDDWHEQAEAMKHRWIDNFASEYAKLPEYAVSSLDKLDVANIVNAHENQIALENEAQTERLREWNE